jgi:hypothetical protein
MTARLGIVAFVLLLPLAALAGPRDDVARIERAARISPQARYDVARDVEERLRDAGANAKCSLLRFAHAHVLQAEGVDRLEEARTRKGRSEASILREKARRGCVGTGKRIVSIDVSRGVVPTHVAAKEDAGLSRRLAALAPRFDGISGVWTHDMTTGRWAAWNADARFPAASLVKLAVAVATPWAPESAYDVRAMLRWSSNLAANRLYREVGQQAVDAALRRMGALHSTYTGTYRVGTGRTIEPPRISARVTTARDVGQMLFWLGANRGDVLTELEHSEQFRDNVGILRPRDPAAQKHGWFSVVRHSAAIVYSKKGPRIVVVLTYAPGLTLAKAQRYGAQVMKTLGLATRGSP